MFLLCLDSAVKRRTEPGVAGQAVADVEGAAVVAHQHHLVVGLEVEEHRTAQRLQHPVAGRRPQGPVVDEDHQLEPLVFRRRGDRGEGAVEIQKQNPARTRPASGAVDPSGQPVAELPIRVTGAPFATSTTGRASNLIKTPSVNLSKSSTNSSKCPNTMT